MSAGDAPAPATPEPFKITPKLALLSVAIILATAMQSLDGTIANVALPHIQGTLSASAEQITWVLTSYVVAAAICTPLTSFMVTRYGRKRLFILALVGFTGTSMLCGAALSLQQAVVFRIVQGAAGAFLVPLSQTSLMDLYPKEKHGAALAAWSMGAMLAPILGPSLGGYLTETQSWRWVFYMNLPLGAFCAIVIAVLLPDSERNPNVRFDGLGFVMLGTAIGALQLTLDRGTMLDWFSSREIVFEASLAVLTFYLFLVHTFTTPRPFLSREPFRNVNYVVGLSIGFVVMLVIFANLALQPTMLQSLMGYPVLTTGLMLMPRGFGSIFTMALAGRLVRHVDPRLMILLGLSVIAATTWQMASFTIDVPPQTIMSNGVFQGAGMGFCFVALTSITFSTLEARHRNEAAAMFGLMRSLGSAIGISMITTLLTRSTQVNHAILSENVSLYNRAFAFLAPAVGLQGMQGVAAIDSELNRQASMMAYLGVFRVMTVLVMSVALLLPLMRVPKKDQPPEEAALAIEA